MTMVPQVNSQLTKIEGSATTADYRTPASRVVKWSGSSGTYFQDRVVSVFNGGMLNRVREVVLYLDVELSSVLGTGDLLTYTYRNVEYQAKAQGTRVRELPGSPSYLRVTLEEVNAT